MKDVAVLDTREAIGGGVVRLERNSSGDYVVVVNGSVKVVTADANYADKRFHEYAK